MAEAAARVGWVGRIAAATAVAGLGVVVAAYFATAEVRAQIANIRGDGEVGAILAQRPRIDLRSPEWSRPISLPRFVAVRSDVEPVWAAHRAALAPIARSRAPSPTFTHGLSVISGWSELKLAWARSLVRHELDQAVYGDRASEQPHPMDALLLHP